CLAHCRVERARKTSHPRSEGMHVVAVSNQEGSRWRWQIWLATELVEESGERYATIAEALREGEVRLGTVWVAKAVDSPLRSRVGGRRHRKASCTANAGTSTRCLGWSFLRR